MSPGEPEAGSIHNHVAQEMSKTVEQPGGFKIFEEEIGSQASPTHPPKSRPKQQPQSFSENYPVIATSSETPTTSLAAIAGDTVMAGDAGYGTMSPDCEADNQGLDDNTLAWGGANIDIGSQHNQASSVVEPEQHEIQAFAKLEFDDGEYYMNTYAVEIGRDIQAARHVADLQAHADTETKSGIQSLSAGGSNTSSKTKHRGGKNKTSSVASDNGVVTATNYYENEPMTKPRSRRPDSRSSSSQQLSRKSSMLLSNGKTDYNALGIASLPGNELAPNDFGPISPMPAPELVPLVPIHPPALLEGAPSSGKSISRKHIRIAYNFEENVFQVKILGRNGGFVDDEWYAQGDLQTLMNGSIIQIGGVGIRFVLPDVAPGETGAESGLGSDPLFGGKESFDMAGSIEDESDEEIDDDEEHSHTMEIKEEEGDEQESEEEEEEVEEPEAV